SYVIAMCFPRFKNNSSNSQFEHEKVARALCIVGDMWDCPYTSLCSSRRQYDYFPFSINDGLWRTG
ncbi:MAG: hypothetical protein VX058_05480, partial [Pseudomonadota bacterium]|nr:hypothetical protein [Pseudomonadota bacterium]